MWRACVLTICGLAIGWATLVSSSARAEERAALAAIFDALSENPARDALFKIPDLGRRLLALRSYARIRTPLVKRWSWTQEEIKAYQGSAEQTALLAEVDAVAAHFAEANPGYEIYARTNVRSLDVQIKKWNANASVGTAGAEILAAWDETFGEKAKAGEAVPAKAFWRWLRGFRPSARARLAAPGLSRHGRGRAIDFQIKKDGKIFAGTGLKDVAVIWGAQGWEDKLKASIEAAGPSFRGPLKNPPEPWHYDYEPEAEPATAD